LRAGDSNSEAQGTGAVFAAAHRSVVLAAVNEGTALFWSASRVAVAQAGARVTHGFPC
jgi:hypothetical protein